MTTSPEITIRISLMTSGCLPGVLRQRIEEVERHKRLVGYSVETAEYVDTFLRQMHECLIAVEEARAFAVSRDEVAAPQLLSQSVEVSRPAGGDGK